MAARRGRGAPLLAGESSASSSSSEEESEAGEEGGGVASARPAPQEEEGAGPGGKGRGRESSSSEEEEERQRPRPRKQVSGRRGGDPPALGRLKRYLRACGMRPNYKKLLGGCRSLREKVGVLRGELRALGLEGPPSLARCRRLRLRREEAAEAAALDVANILPGRPRRRSLWPSPTPPGTSGSPPPAPPPPVDWSRLRGVISSEGDSD